MSDIRNRLSALQRRLDELQVAVGDGNPEANALIVALRDDLNRLSADMVGEAVIEDKAGASSETLEQEGDALKCPRCTLRGLYAVKGRLRERAEGAGREALHHCWSCGYEVWRPS
ncbi:hypothetical protein [Ectothiorhodospira lacustris]|uniref:hypothetical protein n=1 Tax=Ectothiorhodospira lacustris TaxID=2899127 RepID=UPI001EE98C04|nr:hypothetical protein [Ectothiorhodospira lacustris]MCG5499287.1 hypothetical protein [Ectothiorhodospira lacustris]MCG5509176.1 hypothetical protein [Ectothiorhodospira lacustris]MCG5520966.1 hypothetical protein [Ectothiorhodospira lacustris]